MNEHYNTPRQLERIVAEVHRIADRHGATVSSAAGVTHVSMTVRSPATGSRWVLEFESTRASGGWTDRRRIYSLRGGRGAQDVLVGSEHTEAKMLEALDVALEEDVR